VRSFRVFFLTALGAAAFFAADRLAAQAGSSSALVDLCGFQFPAPAGARVVSEDADLIVLQQPARIGDYDARVHWLLSCLPNTRRTSRLSEMTAEIEADGHILHRLEELTLDHEVRAVVFSRTRTLKGRRVKTLEAYFATRDLEYRILIAPDESEPARLDAVSRSSYNDLAGVLQNSLAAGQFRGDVQTTITEAQYRRRLWAIGAAGLTTSLAGLGLILWLRRRRRRRDAAASAGADVSANAAD
jgi:hypothetical protein